MFSEFSIAKDLVHPHIVEYKYFLKDFTEDRDAYEYHVITEYLPEGDMEQHLAKNGPCQNIRLVKSIGKQMLEALVYPRATLVACTSEFQLPQPQIL